MLTESSRLRQQTPLSSRWVLALTILLGQVTMAFSMFAVAVALPSIMHALNGDVTTITYRNFKRHFRTAHCSGSQCGAARPGHAAEDR
jgi:hypothetical protein